MGQKLNQSSILGPVSQIAGVQTGAFIETGTNGNGEYVKYADGTLTCRYRPLTEVSVAKDATLDITWTYRRLSRVGLMWR